MASKKEPEISVDISLNELDVLYAWIVTDGRGGEFTIVT
jgi:hypothetical protein